MEDIKFNISELEKFTDIMAIQDDQWLSRFKQWLQSVVRGYCDFNCLSLVSLQEDSQIYVKMPVVELGEALYNNYYSEIFRLIQYDPEKIKWWENVLENYNQSKTSLNELKTKGIKYMLFHIKEVVDCCNLLKRNDIELSLVDVTEVALARHIAEGKGKQTFHDFMN